jgi:hypothetical protein
MMEGSMTRKHLVCGVAFATVMILALPAANGVVASKKEAPVIQVNRAAKGDFLAAGHNIAERKAPTQAPYQSTPTEQTDKRKIMDGCEPAFSPVTMPSMAHIASRCVG